MPRPRVHHRPALIKGARTLLQVSLAQQIVDFLVAFDLVALSVDQRAILAAALATVITVAQNALEDAHVG